MPEDGGVSAIDAPRPRTGRTPKDVVRSLLVLLVPLALLAAFLGAVNDGDRVTVTDPTPAIAQARSAARFPIETPRDLGEGWRPVSAVFDRADNGGTLRIGYLTPRGDGVQFLASDVPAEDLLAKEVGEHARPLGSADIGGRSWQRYDGRGGELVLVLLEPDRTVMVLGRAPIEDLRTLAAQIR
jgi:hypothetical protein